MTKDYPGQRGKVQVGLSLRREEALTLPEPVLRLAHAEYDRQFPGQPYGLLEVVALLADLAERHGALPSLPAEADGDRWQMPPPPGRATQR